MADRKRTLVLGVVSLLAVLLLAGVGYGLKLYQQRIDALDYRVARFIESPQDHVQITADGAVFTQPAYVLASRSVMALPALLAAWESHASARPELLALIWHIVRQLPGDQQQALEQREELFALGCAALAEPDLFCRRTGRIPHFLCATQYGSCGGAFGAV